MDLSIVNQHHRDVNIIFDEEPHVYYINGLANNISVTTFIHSLFPSFDSDKIIEKMMKSRNWKNSKYYGKTIEEIKNDWETNRIEASKAGTEMHKIIELFYNDNQIYNSSLEFKYFKKFNDEHNELEPYRTEWIVYDEEVKLAGSIDMLYKKKNGDDTNLIMYDWKRSKKINYENQFENGFEPIKHIPNSNYWHYSLQLNIYKKIIEKNYGKIIDEMYLLILHPDNCNYIKIKVPNLENEVNNLFQFRKTLL